jgi:hypothetical protein
MKAGFKVETRICDYWDTVLVVSNYPVVNLVVNYPLICYSKNNRNSSDVGMWRVKQLKN